MLKRILLWSVASVLMTATLLASAQMSSKRESDLLPVPSGQVILKVTGNIDHPNVGDELWLDRAMLNSLEGRTLVTDTPWHRKANVFKGPLLRSVLNAAGIESDYVVIHALNGFAAEIPVTDIDHYDVILAMTSNGEPMAIRDFGPLFVLYPFDEYPELNNNEAIRFRSVWQVDSIEVPAP